MSWFLTFLRFQKSFFPLFGVLANNNSSAESKAQVVFIIRIRSFCALRHSLRLGCWRGRTTTENQTFRTPLKNGNENYQRTRIQLKAILVGYNLTMFDTGLVKMTSLGARRVLEHRISNTEHRISKWRAPGIVNRKPFPVHRSPCTVSRAP